MQCESDQCGVMERCFHQDTGENALHARCFGSSSFKSETHPGRNVQHFFLLFDLRMNETVIENNDQTQTESDSEEEFLHQQEAERSKYDAPPGWFVDEAERRVRDDPDNIISITDALELFGVQVYCDQFRHI